MAAVSVTGLALLVWLAALLTFPTAAWGQDIIGPKSRQTQAAAGPYTIVAEARPLPSLQAAHFIIRVNETASDAPVEDVRVTVLTSLRGSDETGWAHAISPNTPGVYSATVELKTPGVWETTLLIEPAAGDSYGAEGFTFEVTAPAASPEAGYVFIGVAVVLLIGGGYLVWRIRRTQRMRAAGPDTLAP